MPILEELILEGNERIFDLAIKKSIGKRVIFSSSVVISDDCVIQPHCRHCEWQSNLFFDSVKKVKQSKKSFLQRALYFDKMGIRRIVIPSGWQGEEIPSYFFDYISDLALKVSAEIWCAFGAIKKDSLKKLYDLGVKGYSCGIETTNKEIFKKVRPGDNYRKRIETVETAKELGMKTETAMVIGLGEKTSDIIKGIYLMKELDVDYAALWPFCPCPFTQMEKENIPNSFFVSKIISAMVIYLDNKEIVGDTRPKNLKWAIRAGANCFGVSKKEEGNKILSMRDNYLDRISRKTKNESH